MLLLRRSLILVLLFLVSCSSASDISLIPTSTSPLVPEVVDKAIRIDAEYYAENYGISTEEALRRFFLMSEWRSMQAQLIEQEADTFAGVWIEHEPEFLIVVMFTRDGAKTIRPYLENTHLPGVIELREAEVTYQELVTIEMQASQLINQLKLSLIATTSVNIRENRVEITIPDRALLETRLEEAGLEIPEHVEVIISPEAVPEPVPTPQVTPPSGVFFPQLSVSPAMMYSDLNIGKVVLEGGCLRFETGAGADSLLIWSPGYYLNDNHGVIEVLNGLGEPVARTGELSCFSQAAGDAAEAIDQFFGQPPPESCGAPYMLVGWMELANREGYNRNLMEVELISVEENTFYLIQSKAPLQDWLAEQQDFSGMLVQGYDPRSRCMYLRDWGGPGGDLLLWWPPGTRACNDGGMAAICDPDGQVIARLGEQVHLHGSFFQDEGEIRTTLNNELPCDCVGGSYLVVASVEK